VTAKMMMGKTVDKIWSSRMGRIFTS